MNEIPKFRYLAPDSLEEACQILYREKNGGILAGGTDYLIKLHDSKIDDVTCISLKKLNGLKRMLCTDSKLVIGAMVTLSMLENDPTIHKLFPVISETAANMASPQIRNTATIGGNLCNAAPSADMAPPLLVLDAEVKLVSSFGCRVLPLVDFFKGPRITAMKKGEILESVSVPLSSSKMKAVYKKCARRAEVDIATVGMAIAGRCLGNGKLDCIKMAYGAVGPVPFRAFELESMLEGKKITDKLIEDASVLASRIITPISNIRASADYRRTLTRVYTKRLLSEMLKGCN